MSAMKTIRTAIGLVLHGSHLYWAWLGFLGALVAWGGLAYLEQLGSGLIVTNMRDQVSWAFYIGNFTFLVGVASSTVALLIPAYVYDWGPTRHIAILGENLAISAIVTSLLFVVVDMGRPERFWHLMPFVGRLNFPQAVLAWDVVVLNIYLVLNLIVVGYVLGCRLTGRRERPRITHGLIFLTIPAALVVHTITAFIYTSCVGRPYWNTAILVPRFICSAICSGPAIMLVLLQILQKTTKLAVKDEAISKIAEIMAYAMFLSLCMQAEEFFTELYAEGAHAIHLRYLFFGLEGHHALVPFAWASVATGAVSFVLLAVPWTRRNPVTLNAGCLLAYASVYIEKGMGTIVPAFTPDQLGGIYEYAPTLTELRIGAAIFAIGFLVFTVLCKVTVPILTHEFHAYAAQAAPSSSPSTT